MKKIIPFFLVIVMAISGYFFLIPSTDHPKVNKWETKNRPNDMFNFQRSYPDDYIDYKGYNQALKLASAQRVNNKSAEGTINGNWLLEGPTNIGGRINAIAVDPTNSDIIYTGSAAGGIFKTTDGGNTWTPIADDFSYLAISDITIDPSNSNIIYVASGDHNLPGIPHIGNGIYKTTDGGNTWQNIGLEDECVISKIVIDPNNTNTIYAAAMGKPFIRNNNRGVYKSTDGGTTWTQVLFLSNQTGAADLLMDPFDSNVLYCSGWDRIRTNQESLIFGNGGRVWKSTDAGANWTMLTGGLPQFPVGRIGLAHSQLTPNLLFASIVDSTDQFLAAYKSVDGGANWTTLSTNGLDGGFLGGFGWYFGQIRVSPYDDNQISMTGVQMQSSTDGGNTWFQAVPDWWTYQVHADGHDLVYVDSTTILYATDGGLYKTVDNMANWTDNDEIPNSQFYRIAVDPLRSGRYAGGLQDNGTTAGNANSLNTWPRLFGGDGFTVVFDPIDTNLWYCETQNGNLYYSGNLGFQGNSFNNGIDSDDRRNWDMPYIMSNHDNQIFYTGTYRMYENISAPTGTWTAISGDLTDGSIYGDRFHTISTIGESSINEDIIYTGTTDGNVWRSLNKGGSWDSIMTGLPDRYVTDIKASPNDENTVFVCHSGYKYNDNFPHIHKSTDNGDNWVSIAGDLPPLAINHMAIHPNKNDSVIYVATDGGVYATINAGTNWHRVGNMPIISVFDLDLDLINRKLIAGTFARSIQSFPFDDILNYIDPTSPGGIDNKYANVKIYPNPTSDFLIIETNETQNIVLRDLTGKTLLSRVVVNSDRIDLSHFSKGVYILTINEEFSQKIMKQ